jgi:hypothetical protein
MNGFDQLRQRLIAENCASYSSIKYQDDVLRFIVENADKGGDIIEVGCYKGGMTAQLAVMANKLRRRLCVVDTSMVWLDHTQALLERLGVLGPTTFFYCGHLSILVATPTLVIVLDADHRYNAVGADIVAIKKIQPYAVVFHDFSLRHVSEQYGVDRAIYDSFGQDVKLVKIGDTTDKLNSFSKPPYCPTGDESHPEDGWYWEENGQEGVILIMNGRMPKGSPHEQ